MTYPRILAYNKAAIVKNSRLTRVSEAAVASEIVDVHSPLLAITSIGWSSQKFINISLLFAQHTLTTLPHQPRAALRERDTKKKN